MKIKALFFLLLIVLSTRAHSCPTDSADSGEVSAKIIGIEVHESCTYLLLSDVSTTLPVIDSGGFIAGRFTYIALDPNHTSYNSMLTLATMGYAANKTVYANVTSRLARVNYLSLSDLTNDS